MNIIYLISDHTWGCPSQYFLDIAEAMKSHVHSVTVVTSSGKRSAERFSAKLGEANVATISTFRPIGMIQLSGILKKAGPAIIHTGNISDASIAVRAKEMSGNDEVHPVVTLHSGVQLSNSSLEHEILERAEAIISVNPTGLPLNISDSTHIMPYSVPERTADNAGHPAKKTIVFHGRITPEKHLERLFEAASKLSDIDFRIRIIGEGNARNVMPLKQSTRRLDIADRVDWMGYREDVPDLLRGCSVGVYPSSGQSAYAIRECLSQGVPVLTEPTEPLEESLRKTLTQPEYAGELIRKNKTLCRQTFPEFIRSLTSIYSGLL